MPGRLRAAITQRAASFFKFRDDLRLGNIRRELWPLLLVFPLSVIMGNLRYFDLKMATAGFESWELMLLPMGLGWLILAFTPRRLILPLLRVAAVLSAALLAVQIFMPSDFMLTDPGRLLVFMAFQFSSGICAAAAFCLFCFELNNIERLFGVVVIQAFYAFFYILWLAFPDFQAAGETWGGAVATAACLIVVFACKGQKIDALAEKAAPGPETSRWAGGAALAIGLHVVYYLIMYVTGHIRWTESSLSGMAFGIGAFASVILILVVQVLSNRSALYVWLLFLVLTLAALGVLMYESPATRLSGSFAYGLGEGLGYVVIYYLCAAAINKSKRLAMFRLFCLALFVEYAVVSGIFAWAFARYGAPNLSLAFGVVLALCLLCFLLLPLTRKRLFEEDWTDGVPLRDMAEYAPLLAETDAINRKGHLNLTDREHEVFTMLLKDMSPKEIAGTLKVSYHTVVFHRQNLYQKLGIQSRAELFAQFLPSKDGKPS